MSAETQVPQSKPTRHRLGRHPLTRAFPPDFPPITPEDLAKLGVESQLIPFVVSTTLRAEQSPNGSPPLSPADAENLIEILDKVRLTHGFRPPR